ncbi:RNA polymerase sigma factor [Rhodococcoides trifolii]|uniref:RNA polymerase sigma factor n=1 Tax=Rhodococcoides trifolii TaxID=908250 RepID=UPI001E43F1CE|nr:sigma-70 family RNA polymerase sigma factor [Rhodococcus trifolii]
MARTVGSEHFDLTRAYDAHASSMLGFAVNALRDRALAEECVQETFLRAWRARHTFDSAKGQLLTWLFAIERNVITDVLRSVARMPSITAGRYDDADAIEQDSTAQTVERLRVVEALAVLSPEHRQVVVAVHVIGSSYAELSASTGIPVSTLRTRAFYALRALRSHLDGQEER